MSTFIAEPRKLQNVNAISFMLAGNATFTVRSMRTSTRYTFKVQKADEDSVFKGMWFVKVLNGPDNVSNYRNIGKIKNNAFSLTGKAKADGMNEETPSFKAFLWTFNHLLAGTENFGVEIWHACRCGRCGRKLTVPESVDSGYGPECVTKMAA